MIFPAAIAQADMVAMVVQPPPPPSEDKGGQGEDFGKSSPLGFLVLILFMVAVVFLARSMTKHLKRVPASFDEPGEEPTEETAEPKQADGGKKPED
jgi:H+/gluconate symporter-like permease